MLLFYLFCRSKLTQAIRLSKYYLVTMKPWRQTSLIAIMPMHQSGRLLHANLRLTGCRSAPGRWHSDKGNAAWPAAQNPLKLSTSFLTCTKSLCSVNET